MAENAGSCSSSDNGDHSRNSSQSSGSEEEQLRRLFNSCDADGDGYLDGEDLRFMCRMLNMPESVQEVREQLGLSETSRISFQDFLHCRTKVMLQSASAASPFVAHGGTAFYQEEPSIVNPGGSLLSHVGDGGTQQRISPFRYHPNPHSHHGQHGHHQNYPQQHMTCHHHHIQEQQSHAKELQALTTPQPFNPQAGTLFDNIEAGCGLGNPTTPLHNINNDHHNLHQHHYPAPQHQQPSIGGGGTPAISLPSSMYPYPHQSCLEACSSISPCQHSKGGSLHHIQGGLPHNNQGGLLQHNQGGLTHHNQVGQLQFHSQGGLPQHYHSNLPRSPSFGGGGIAPMPCPGEDTRVESDTTGGGGNKLTSWPTLSSDSLGALSCTKSTDYDSGARDLSPEPTPHLTLTLSQLVESHDPVTFARLREAGTDSLLHIADRLHAAALTSMKGEVLELQTQVKRLNLQHQPLTSSPGAGQGQSKNQLPACDSRLGPADFEDRLEQLTARYEERIIELHSVIAELRKKVERHQISVIREEDEEEESDLAQSTHSNDAESFKDENIEITQEFSRIVSEIQPTMDRASLPPDENVSGVGLSTSFTTQIKAETEEDTPNTDRKQQDDPTPDRQPGQMVKERGEEEEEKVPELPPRAARPSNLSSAFTSDPAVRLEVANLRAHNDELRRQTSEVTALRHHNDELKRRGLTLEAELAQLSLQLEAESAEKDRLNKQMYELSNQLQRLEAGGMVTPTQSRVASPIKTAHGTADVRGAEGDNYPVAKMAELKKLRTCASDPQVHGSEVAYLGVEGSSTAEHLVQSMHQGSGVAELLKSGPPGGGTLGRRAEAVDSRGDLCGPVATGDRGEECGVKHDEGVLHHQQQQQGLSAAVVAEFEVELERRQAKCDHLKAQNDVLSATLEESRSMAERLSVQLGKYESNSTALQLSSTFSDQCLEAQDILTALLDTEMGVLLANCRAAGLGALAGGGDHSTMEDQEEVTAVLRRAHHARRKAETVAGHLLARLDRGGGGVGAGGSQASGGKPWEDVSTNSRTASTSSTSSSTENQQAEFTKLDEVRLREHIQQLKGERSAVRTTVLEIESVHMDPIIAEPRKRVEAQRLDLENAVLVQELMAVKEEKAELKAGSYLLEKEKKALELRLIGHEAQESALRLQVEHLEGELNHMLLLQQQESDNNASIINTNTKHQRKQQQSSSPSLGIMGKKSKHASNSGNSGGRGSPCSTLSSSSASSSDHIPVTKSAAELTRDLAVAKAREATLKGRVTELLSALEKLSKNSELRHRQSSEFVGDLKRANAALISAFDRAKRKYQARLKKMEGQLRVLREAGVLDGSGVELRRQATKQQTGGVVVMRQNSQHSSLPPPDETSL